jgi:glycosyltransferase involved in cell wall biosynthesis
LFGSEEAIAIAKERGIDNIKVIQVDKKNTKKNFMGLSSLLQHTMRRIYMALVGLKTHWAEIQKIEYVYSVSDFYPEMIPALITKIFNKKTKWIAGFYLFAPFPFSKDNPYKKNNFLKGIVYWLFQIPSYFLVKWFADFVLVTSTPDVQKFITRKRPSSKIVVVQGGVDITNSEKYLQSNLVIPVNKRKFEACFIGRLHPQKGVLQLVDIWKIVCDKRPSSKLVIIGDGELQHVIEKKIRKMGLEKNIDLVGFKDGVEKEKIFKESKIILHPAGYDSGGMAAAEGMAYGLPGVSYDLEALKSYYPQGMIKTVNNDKQKFADNIIMLLENQVTYNRLSVEAHNLIKNYWNWSNRANIIYKEIFNEK